MTANERGIMPDEHGKLSPSERSAIDNWLESRWVFRKCPCCGHEEWIEGEHLLMDTAYPGENPTQARRMVVVPYVVRFCAYCAYTLRFNWTMMEDLQNPSLARGSGVRTNG